MEKMRDSGWNTAKARSFERRAYIYQKVYREVLYPDQTPGTVIIPVTNNSDTERKCLEAFSNQTYKNIELIVCDDSIDNKNYNMVKEFSQYVNIPVRYIRTAQLVVSVKEQSGAKDYGLARARNEGIIEATGEIIVFCDERQIPEPDAVAEFCKYVKPGYWVFGNKGGNKTAFVENFSCIYRRDIIKFGLFPERATKYGFLSQYCRAVARDQNLRTEYCKTAKASPLGKSSNRNKKRNEIIESKNKLFKLDLE